MEKKSSWKYCGTHLERYIWIFLRLKQKFPGTLGVWIVDGGGSDICSAY